MLKKAYVAYKAFRTLNDYALGAQGLGVVVKSGFGCDVVTAAAITSGYAKCKVLDELLPIFNVIPLKSLEAWSTIIAGRVQNDKLEGGLDLFEEMQREGIGVNPSVYALGVGTAILDMYVKCGGLLNAAKVFNLLLNHNMRGVEGIQLFVLFLV